MCTNYTVIIESFAERHFEKSFLKKYKKAWTLTQRSICEELRRFDSLLQTSIAETITENGDIRIAKTDFRVAGTKESRKSSGNRCIVAVHKDKELVKILLIYHKSHLGDGSETAKWKQIIKENYPEYRNLI